MHRSRQLVLATLLFTLLCSPAVFANTWKAGAASAAITPDDPMWMAGYAARRKPSEGKVHDLYAKALALEDEGGTRLVMVTLDLISVPRPIRDWLEQAVGDKFSLPPEGLLMNCSHTHCGPEIRTTTTSLRGLETSRVAQTTAYVERLQQQLLEIVGQAIERLEPATVAYCRARAGFAMNRRTPSDSGFRNFPNPDGPVDHDVPVLRVENAEGELKAILFGYACHNTTLGFYQFCGDYAGFAQEYLEEAHPGAIALFMLGCGGDQNPYPRSKLELALQHGRTLATAVEAALQTQQREVTGKLQAAYDTTTLDYATPPSRERVVELSQSSNQYDRAWGERLLDQWERDGKLRETYDAPVQVVRFGDTVTMVALPGETVIDYSLRLKRELAGQPGAGAVWVAGYSNDVFAYIPSRRVLEEGGYEAGGAMRYMTTTIQPGPFAPSVERKLIGKVHELNRTLHD